MDNKEKETKLMEEYLQTESSEPVKGQNKIKSALQLIRTSFRYGTLMKDDDISKSIYLNGIISVLISGYLSNNQSIINLGKSLLSKRDMK